MTKYILAGIALAILTNQPGAPHPAIGIAAGTMLAFAPVTFAALRFAMEAFFAGLFGGWGLSVSGIFRQRRQPRRRNLVIRSARAALEDGGREPRPPRRWRGREDHYQPWPGR
jgi:hypothetical protein